MSPKAQKKKHFLSSTSFDTSILYFSILLLRSFPVGNQLPPNNQSPLLLSASLIHTCCMLNIQSILPVQVLPQKLHICVIRSESFLFSYSFCGSLFPTGNERSSRIEKYKMEVSKEVLERKCFFFCAFGDNGAYLYLI